MKTLTEKREEEIKELNKLKPLEAEYDPFPDATGVYLSDKIQYLAKYHDLIKPFKIKCLKPAGYELTVGDEYYLGGKYYNASDTDSGEIIIDPFEVIVIKTAERVCIPRFLIARWNIRVNFAYKGLLWVGGPQVDPGYKGHLFCPLYNLSDKPVRLPIGEPIAPMDFVKTTKHDKSDVLKKNLPKFESLEEIVRYRETPKRVIIEDYDIKELKSALYTKAGEKIDKFSEEIRMIENKFNAFTTITFAILAIVVSALTILPKNDGGMKITYSIWGGLVVALSVFSVMLSLCQFHGKYIKSLEAIFGYRLKVMTFAFIIAVIVGVIVAICMSI